jgi:hypothetical protein
MTSPLAFPQIPIQQTQFGQYRWRRMTLSVISLLLALIVLCLLVGVYSNVHVQFPLIVAVLTISYSVLSFALYYFMTQIIKPLFLVDLFCAFMAFVGWLIAGLSLHEGIFFAKETKSILIAAALFAFLNLLPHLLLPFIYNPYCPGVSILLF